MPLLRALSRPHELRDDQWNLNRNELPGRLGSLGVTAANNRWFVDAVIHRYRCGIPWRDLPDSYRGILQCDGYAAYKKFGGSRSADPAVTLAFCWSHVRRGFYDLAKAKAPIAIEALKRIAALYAIEVDIRGKSATERRIARQAESKPLIVELRIWFEALVSGKIPAQSWRAAVVDSEGSCPTFAWAKNRHLHVLPERHRPV